MLFLTLVMSLMTGLSGQVSTDHLNYVNIYDKVKDLSYFSNYSIIQLIIGGGFIEPGYALLNIICHKLGLSTVGFFVVVAFVTNWLAVLSIFKFPRPPLGILLFIVSTHFFYQTNLVRQMIAVSGFLFCFSFLYEKRCFAYVISVIILMTFHSSAILLLPLLIFNYLVGRKIIRYMIPILWVLSVMILFTGNQLNAVSEVLNTVFGGTVYERYTSGDRQLGAGYGIAYIYNVFTILSFYIYRTNKYWCINKFLYILVFQLGCIIVNIASSIETLTRFALYFSCFQFVILPYMTADCKVFNKRPFLISGKIIHAFLIFYYGVYILGYTFIVRGGTLLGKEMYSITNFFN